MLDVLMILIECASKIGSIKHVNGSDDYISITVSNDKGKIYDFYISVKEDKDA